MAVRALAVAEIEQRLQGVFPGAEISRKEDRGRINFTVNGIQLEVDVVRPAVRVLIDSGAHLAFRKILSEGEAPDCWRLDASLTDGQDDNAITLTVTYFRQLAIFKLSIDWPQSVKQRGMQ